MQAKGGTEFQSLRRKIDNRCAIIDTIDDYAKDGGSGEVWLLCSFYHDSLRAHIIRKVNNFATLALYRFQIKDRHFMKPCEAVL